MPPPATQREHRLFVPPSCPGKPDRRWGEGDAIPYLILIWSEDLTWLSTCSQELWSSHRTSWSKFRKSLREEQQRKTLPAPQRQPLQFTPLCTLVMSCHEPQDKHRHQISKHWLWNSSCPQLFRANVSSDVSVRRKQLHLPPAENNCCV